LPVATEPVIESVSRSRTCCHRQSLDDFFRCHVENDHIIRGSIGDENALDVARELHAVRHLR
jgi:hypothetical protein